MAPRIDFKHVREHADIDRVCAHFDIDLKPDGVSPTQKKGLCPFHDDSKPSLKVNLEKRVFHCFACGAKGNVIDFVMQHEGLDIRPAAQLVAEISGITTTASGSPAPARKRKKNPVQTASEGSSEPHPPTASETPAVTTDELDGEPYNRPLTFELKLTQDEELTAWLAARGIDETTIETFGLGRASKKSKSIPNRLAIPIHDEAGRLVAYCGRYLGDDKADDEPKYRLPSGFLKERALFNLHRLPERPEYVVLFESYLSVIRHQGHLNAVSSFGRDLSSWQLERLKASACRRFAVVFDGDEPGRTGAQAVAGQLATIGWVKRIELPDGVKPHHLSWEEFGPVLREQWV